MVRVQTQHASGAGQILLTTWAPSIASRSPRDLYALLTSPGCAQVTTQSQALSDQESLAVSPGLLSTAWEPHTHWPAFGPWMDKYSQVRHKENEIRA